MELYYYFNKLCWVCLAEENNMHSILDDLKISVDNRYSPISLCDLLSYVTSTEVLFVGGPYQICNNCKLQACAAYKFKKRCEVSTKVFKKCDLITCTKDTLSVKLKDESFQNVPNKEGPIETCNKNINEAIVEICNEESNETNGNSVEDVTTTNDATLNNKSMNNDAVSLVVEDTESSLDDDLKSLEDPKAENARLPRPRSKTFLCTICGQHKSKKCIRQHMLRHANVKNHICPFCPRKFCDKSNLNVHMRIHTGVHPYVCDICGKKFIQASGLKCHKRVHDGVKPYKCHICNYSTRTSSALQLHIKRHIGLKNYHCEQCDYSACSKAELKYHLAKHSDERSHVCKTCGKAFSRRKSLKTHEKSHTGEKPYTCELCGRGFTQAHSLRSHLRNIHKKSDV